MKIIIRKVRLSWQKNLLHALYFLASFGKSGWRTHTKYETQNSIRSQFKSVFQKREPVDNLDAN